MSRRLWCVGVVSACLTLAACTSGSTDKGSPSTSPSVSPTSTSTVTATAPVPVTSSAPTPSASSSTGTTGSATPAAAGGTIPCTPTVSSFSVGGQNGASMHVVFVVTARNASRQTCVTQGYPGVALLNATGRQIEQAKRTREGFMGGLSSGAPPRIVLHPGQRASARIEGFTINEATQKTCPHSPAILFTLPDNRDSTRIRVSFPACAGVQVHPMLPGTTGTR